MPVYNTSALTTPPGIRQVQYTPPNVLCITTHFFARNTTHIFPRIASQLERLSARKIVSNSRHISRTDLHKIVRRSTCTKLCIGPHNPSIIVITKKRDKISSQQTALSARKHCAQITSQQTAILLADIVHRSHHSMLHILRHTNNPCDVSTTCANRGGSAALACKTLKSCNLTKNGRVVHKSTLLEE